MDQQAGTPRQLRRILEAERKLGYANRAVIGGLDGFLARWSEAARERGDAYWRAAVASLTKRLPVYRDLDETQRRQWLEGVLRDLEVLERMDGTGAPGGRDGRASASPGTSPAPGADLTPSPPSQPGKGERPAPLPGRGGAGGEVGSRAGKAEDVRQETPPDRVSPSPQRATGTSPARKSASHVAPPQNGERPHPERPASTVSRPPSKTRDPQLAARNAVDLDSPVTAVPGVNTATAKKLERLNVRTVRDLLFFFPRRHDDYSRLKTVSQLIPGQHETVIVNTWEVRTRRSMRGMPMTEAVVGDETGNMRVVWFNQPYVEKQLNTSGRIVLSGLVTVYQGLRTMQAPEWEPADAGELMHTGRLVPVYSSTEGLSQRTHRRLAKAAIDRFSGLLVDHLPLELKARRDLLGLVDAVQQMHFPDELSMLERARDRLAFDELFVIQLGALLAKRQWQEGSPAEAMPADEEVVGAFIRSLPFVLTAAQRRVLEEIFADLARPRPMIRLLQGEVGSGKTVVAAASLLAAVTAGYQGVLMAPTEILAQQHHRSLQSLFEGFAVREPGTSGVVERHLIVRLLIGSLPRREKGELYERIADGEVDIIVGTHALIQEDVEFKRLALAVIDEQHRFGVEQRTALVQKGRSPHLLVMTATPIPRSLALTLYGDLDLSAIDEMPPGRRPVKTRAVSPEKRQLAYQFVREQIDQGRQAFVICPLVEESEKLEARAATAEHERLSREVFPELSVGLLHGRMRTGEKDAVMAKFRSGELDVLVSTAVVEVGVDVPNATIMMIEGADRFGLAQLHQFRGRVGRGAHQSYCLLLSDDPSPEAQKRLGLVESTTDGLALAEQDLELRGPGEYLGTRQSGLPDLRVARLTDLPLIDAARREAADLLAADPDLNRPDHELLRDQVGQFWQLKRGGIS